MLNSVLFPGLEGHNPDRLISTPTTFLSVFGLMLVLFLLDFINMETVECPQGFHMIRRNKGKKRN
jgi:hypothetical protein